MTGILSCLAYTATKKTTAVSPRWTLYTFWKAGDDEFEVEEKTVSDETLKSPPNNSFEHRPGFEICLSVLWIFPTETRNIEKDVKVFIGLCYGMR